MSRDWLRYNLACDEAYAEWQMHLERCFARWCAAQAQERPDAGQEGGPREEDPLEDFWVVPRVSS